MAVKIVLSFLTPLVLGYFLGVWLIEDKFEKEVGELYAPVNVKEHRTFQLT